MGKHKRKSLLKGMEGLSLESPWNAWIKQEILRQTNRKLKGRGKRVSVTTRHKAYLRDGGCAKCRCGDIMTVHHIIPKRLGGTNHLDNLMTLCDWCHADWNSAEAKDEFKWFQFFIWLRQKER